jgi:hypothetical protein
VEVLQCLSKRGISSSHSFYASWEKTSQYLISIRNITFIFWLHSQKGRYNGLAESCIRSKALLLCISLVATTKIDTEQQ